MSSFISKSACCGNRPKHLLSYRYYQRQRLVSHLLKERGIARFVIAPYGYGKTGLALEYADTIFGFTGVYWINCTSPCFVRDLDAGGLAQECLKSNGKLKLVVFEDMPYLDVDRAESFSREIDELLERKCEVLVTCTPSCDTLGRLQQDRMTITARDLLLDDDELSVVHEGVSSIMALRAAHTPSCRIPILMWPQRQTSIREFLSKSFREEAPADLLLALMCTAVLESGSFDDLVGFGPIDRDLIAESASNYPHLGFNDGLDAFEAPPFDLTDIAFALRGVVDSFVGRSSFDSRQALTYALADKLIDAGRLGRACDVIRSICPRKTRMGWIERNAFQLFGGACFLPLLRLAESIKATGLTMSQRSLLAIVNAVCLWMLDDRESACRHAKRYAFEQQAPIDHRILALVTLAKCSTTTLKGRANDELATIAAASQERNARFSILAEAWCMASLDLHGLVKLWNDAASAGIETELLCVIASWFYGAYGADLDGTPAESTTLLPVDFAPMERFVRARIGVGSASDLDFFSASAGLAMESAHLRGMDYYEGPLSTAALIALRNIEMSLLSQRGRYDTESAQSAIKHDDWLITHPESALNPRRMRPRSQNHLSVPTLSIKTFGRLELTIGDETVDPDLLAGTHVRSLIILLAAGQGREISRDALCRSMWPNSELQVARKSFYTIWSKLRQALVLPDGSCPYLVRHRLGCSFDPSLVQSDIARLETICRSFLFEDPDYTRWSDLLIEIDRDFASDLLPSETKNELVLHARDEYRTKIVDALVVASEGIAATGNLRRAIWCAQMALDHDDTREDAYLALMRSQAAAGQRAAAMATCRRGIQVLAEKLGLDPSPEMMKLYQQLLDSGDE